MNRKAFTLIELLVVVAIIGILAAVGVVAYNGYTGSAKIAATKSNHATIVNFMSSEITKCLLGETSLNLKKSNGSTTTVSCNTSSVNTITLGSRFVDHFRGSGFKNAFNNPDNNGTLFTTTGNSPVLGQTRIVNAGGNKIQIVTKFSGSNGQWGGNANEVLISNITDER
jgi:type IV pilus assembly protein PilA